MFVSVRMQFHNHVDTASETFRKCYPLCNIIYDIKFGTLQVRNNDISLRKCSGGSAHLRTLEETLVTRESARFDNNGSEPKSQVRRHKFHKKIKIF